MIDKILIITAFPPNQKTAGQDYTRRLICELVARGVQVDIIYANYPGHDVELPDQVNVLKIIYPSMIKCVKKLYVHPFFTKRYDSNVCKYLQSIANNYSIVYFDFSQVHIYAKYVMHPFKVLICHDVICQKYSRNTCELNVKWIKKCENDLLKTAKYIFTFCKKDSNLLRNIYNIDSHPVNNYLKKIKYEYDISEKIEDVFCFYGAWNRKENIEAITYFVEKIYPKLKKSKSYIVIGGGMSNKLKSKIESNCNFRCLGFVDDPINTMARCQALIAPLHYGAGIKFKVLDALTAGTPVIGTNVAFEGIEDNEVNSMLYLAETIEDYMEILDNWRGKDVEYKQRASDEFCHRYNVNHFPEVIERLYI